MALKIFCMVDLDLSPIPEPIEDDFDKLKAEC